MSPSPDVLRPEVTVDFRKRRVSLDQVDHVEPREVIRLAKPGISFTRKLQILLCVDRPSPVVTAWRGCHRKQLELIGLRVNAKRDVRSLVRFGCFFRDGLERGAGKRLDIEPKRE